MSPHPQRFGIPYRALFLFLLLLCGTCWASPKPEDARDEVHIWIVKPQNGQGGAGTDQVVSTLVGRLQANRFQVEVTDAPIADPRAAIQQRANTHHLITDIVVGSDQSIAASVYSRGADSPKLVQGPTADIAALQVLEFLRDPATVKLRAGMKGLAQTDFAKALHDGLEQLSDRDDAAAAIPFFERAAALRSDSPTPRFDLSLCYKRLGKEEQRKEQVELGLKLDPANQNLLNERALILMNEDDYRGAIAILKDLPAKDPLTQWNLAYAYGQLGDKVSAQDHLQQVIQLQADPTLSTLAEAQLSKLASFRKILWGSAGFMLLITGVVGGSLLVQRLRRSSLVGAVGTNDRLAMYTQVGVCIIGGVFSLLTAVLTTMMSQK